MIFTYCNRRNFAVRSGIGSTSILAMLGIIIAMLLPDSATCGRGQGTTILVARDTEMSGFEYHIKAELEAAGFNVVLFEIDFREDTQRAIDSAARTQNAAASVICKKTAGFVEIWIADKVTDKTVLRRVAIPEEADAESFVAISTVELLRASLLEIHTVSQLRGQTETTAEIERLIAPSYAKNGASKQVKPTSRLCLQVNPAILIFRFSGNPNFNIQIGGSYIIYQHLELKIHGQTPVLPHRISQDEGEILVHVGYAALGVDWLLAHPRHLASGDIGIGMALLGFRIAGQPTENNTGFQKSIFTPAPHITFGMDVRLVPQIRIRLETMAGWSLSKIEILTDQKAVAQLGNLFVSAGLGVLFQI